MALVLNRRLLLHITRLKERILLEPDLVLDDDRRNAETLKRADEECKVLGKTSGVTIVDDRLGGDFKNIIHRTQTRGDVNRLVIGLALECRVRQRREPHGIKLVLYLRAVGIRRILRNHGKSIFHN